MRQDNKPPYRIGHGYDLHRLERLPEPESEGDKADRPFMLGGIHLKDTDLAPVGHSDGDAVLHAVTDAILGALGEPDIGEIFPDSSPKWKDADSKIFLREAVARARAARYAVSNADVTIILEEPKVAPVKDAMRLQLANLLDISPDCVNVKGKTHEKVDAVGEGRAIEVHTVVLLQRTTG